MGKPSSSVMLLLMLATISTVTATIQCPDKEFTCPDKQTCCQLGRGMGYGCCPMFHAVCCDDGEHCCPHDTVCDTKKGACVPKPDASAAYAKLLMLLPPLQDQEDQATKTDVESSEHICPDKQMVCPEEATCCKLAGGSSYGCCPMPNATCCKDGLHCCPHATVCDVKQGRCNPKAKDYFISKMIELVATSKKQSSESQMDSLALRSGHHPNDLEAARYSSSSVVCPDGITQCPDDNICCPFDDGGYGCCPSLEGVCCPGDYCCQGGSVCSDRPGTNCEAKKEWPFGSNVF